MFNRISLIHDSLHLDCVDLLQVELLLLRDPVPQLLFECWDGLGYLSALLVFVFGRAATLDLLLEHLYLLLLVEGHAGCDIQSFFLYPFVCLLRFCGYLGNVLPELVRVILLDGL